MSETKAEYKTKKKDKKFLGFIKLNDGRKLQIKKKATGKELYRAMDKGYNGELTGALYSQLVSIDDKPLQFNEVENLESGLTIAIKEAVTNEVFIKPIDVENYPYQYEMVVDGVTKKVEVIEERKTRHDTEAMKLSQDVANRVGFWLIHLLIKIDGERLSLNQILELSMAEVEELAMLVQPKKYVFTLNT